MSSLDDWEDIQGKYELENIPLKIDELSKAIELAWVTDSRKARGGLYFLIDNLSKLLTAYLHADVQHADNNGDWLDTFEYTDGTVPTEDEKKAILAAIKSNQDILQTLKNPSVSQQGGADLHLNTKHSKIVQGPKIPFDISINRGFDRLRTYITSIDEQVHSITDELGPTAFISKMPMDPKIPLPFPPGIVSIPKHAILPFITATLEIIKLFFLLNPFDFGLGRKMISIVQAIYEFSIGNWRQSIMSFMGVFGQGIGLLATFGKFLLNAWLFIEPSLRSKLELYMFRGTKSMIASFMIWLFHIFAPDLLWVPIAQFIETLNQMLESTSEQAASLEEKLTEHLQTMGYTGYSVKLPSVDEIITGEKGTKLQLSYEDLQNIQRLLALPIIQCSKEGQAVIAPLLETPARIIFELIGVPTTPDALKEVCGVNDIQSIPSMSTTISKAVVDGTEIIPPS